MRKQKKTKKSRKTQADQLQLARIQHPPMITPPITVTRTYRFYSTYDLEVILTAQALVGIAGGVGTVANTTYVQVARAFRVHRISIWTPPRQGNPAAGLGQFSGMSCAIEWHSLDNIPAKRIADRSVSPSEASYVSGRPPRGSALDMWQDGPTGGNVCTLLAPVGSIIDVHATHVFFMSGASGGAVTANPVVVGAYYYPPLDGSGTVRYLPADGLPTTY